MNPVRRKFKRKEKRKPSKLEIILDTLELVQEGTLEAPEAFAECPMKTLITVCNGCGAEDSKFDFVPDTMWGLYIGHACMVHDFEYEVGKTSADKKLADRRFRANLVSLIYKESTWILRYPRLIIADAYYKAVDVRGYSAFFTDRKSNP